MNMNHHADMNISEWESEKKACVEFRVNDK